MLQANKLKGKTIVIINSTFFETVIHVDNFGYVDNFDKDGYLNCIAINVSEDEWGFSEIDQNFLAKWSSDIEPADKKYKEWSIQSLFEGERNDWILDKES